MNKANLKSYAPKARLDFIKAVTERANVLGISAAGVVAAEVRGDVALIDGREWPAKVAGQRDELIARIKRHGFEQTMDEVAYTWFNRFAALRYMEIHDYLGHGWRVLSSRDGGLPEILRHASEVTLPGLNPDQARQMQLAGNQDNELYKLLLVAQCNELSRVMPFLFERIDDETELLLPENLLRTDSIVAKLVEQVPEEDWQEIEVIGWLYQFYISEKKELLTGKVVKSEDIPAATQLFTPNWIVQYMVQNSVGRLWLMANPSSMLSSQWPYYIEPAKQTPEVQAQLEALMQTRVREDGETLNPETITVLDPACGSGHILVVAYDVLKAIYLERGYQARSIPRLILEKNLYGMDIDDRAAQLAAFALLMRARADDRRLFSDPPMLNVLSLQESEGLLLDDLERSLASHGVPREHLKVLLDTFGQTRTLGSLIQIPSALKAQISELTANLQEALRDGDLYARQSAKDVLPLMNQARVLGMDFDVVVANPPYLGAKTFNAQLKSWVRREYDGFDRDLFSIFIVRILDFTKPTGCIGLMTSFAWMFNSSYERLRQKLIESHAIDTLIQLHYDAFAAAKAHVCTFTLKKTFIDNYQATFIRLADFPGVDVQAPKTLEAIQNRECGWLYQAPASEFKKLPGQPLAYWISQNLRKAFDLGVPLANVAEPKQGLSTADTNRFLRRWPEVSSNATHRTASSPDESRKSKARWFPHSKGGEFRRWFGNNDWLIDWEDDGARIRDFPNAAVRNSGSYFKGGITWSDLTSSLFNARRAGLGFAFDTAGPTAVLRSESNAGVLHALMNSNVFQRIIGISLPGLHYNNGTVGLAPVVLNFRGRDLVEFHEAELVRLAKSDWDSYERSWDFQGLPFLPRPDDSTSSLKECYENWIAMNCSAVTRMKYLEEENNRHFIDAYGLAGELTPDVPIEQITLTGNPAYRYSGRLTESEMLARFRRDSMVELVSYSVGCMMGRYSLDEPGIVYAHAGNVGFDHSRYAKRFPADADGIVPVVDDDWYEDDAASRLREFLRAAWGPRTLEENSNWLAECLVTKGHETPQETIRRYFADQFFRDHLQTYKKRPIYWLFSSGKQGAFQALVYLHRYNEGTLARMRAEYVVPLIAKMVSRLDMLDKDVVAASSAAARTKLQKQIEALRKKQIELLAYDEKLRHHADMRITLDLDDGVKINYAKFGDLVAEAKAITGGKDED